MNDLMKSDLKMSSLNIRTTYHIYYFTFKLYFFIIHFFVTLNLIQTNFGFIVCYDIDNVHIEVNIRGGSRNSCEKSRFCAKKLYFFQFYGGRGGGGAGCAPGSVPGASIQKLINIDRRKLVEILVLNLTK